MKGGQKFSNETDIIPVSKPITFLFKLLFPVIFFKTDTSHYLTMKNLQIPLKHLIKTNELNTNITLDNQLKWALLNYEIRRFTGTYRRYAMFY